MDILGDLSKTLEQYRRYIPEYIHEICMMLFLTPAMPDSTSDEYQCVRHIYDIIRQACCQQPAEKVVDGFWQEYNYQRLNRDNRFSDTMERAYDAFFGIIDAEPIVQKFGLLDTQLCMIEERGEILEQAEIVKKDYPEFYKKMQDFLQKLENEKNLGFLKDSLQKTYRRLEPDFGGGHYYQKYPHEKELARGTLISNGMDGEPYVRSTKKVGRNDPCPCGSGKKYKQCCMNK